MKKNLWNNKGITLIALVITIVTLIVLAGVLISLTLGDNGILQRVKRAKEDYANAQGYEETEIAKISNEIDSYVGGYRNIEGKLQLYKFGNLTGIATSTGRSKTENLEKGNYIIVLNEFSANGANEEDVEISLNDERNSYEVLKIEKTNYVTSYSSASALGTFYVTIEEPENIVLIGKDEATNNNVGAGLIYQIYKII